MIAVSAVGMLLCAPFWWGFDLPFAWLNSAVVTTFLVLGWTLGRAASTDDTTRTSGRCSRRVFRR